MNAMSPNIRRLPMMAPMLMPALAPGLKLLWVLVSGDDVKVEGVVLSTVDVRSEGFGLGMRLMY